MNFALTFVGLHFARSAQENYGVEHNYMHGKLSRGEALALANAVTLFGTKDGFERFNFVLISTAGKTRLNICSATYKPVQLSIVENDAQLVHTDTLRPSQSLAIWARHLSRRHSDFWIFTLYVFENGQLRTFYSEDYPFEEMVGHLTRRGILVGLP